MILGGIAQTFSTDVSRKRCWVEIQGFGECVELFPFNAPKGARAHQQPQAQLSLSLPFNNRAQNAAKKESLKNKSFFFLQRRRYIHTHTRNLLFFAWLFCTFFMRQNCPFFMRLLHHDACAKKFTNYKRRVLHFPHYMEFRDYKRCGVFLYV